MGIHIRIVREGGTATAHVAGRMEFAGRKRFQQMRETLVAEAGVSLIRLDMGSVTHVDSAALGMVMLLLEAAEATGKRVALANPVGSVRAALGATRLAGYLDS